MGMLCGSFIFLNYNNTAKIQQTSEKISRMRK